MRLNRIADALAAAALFLAASAAHAQDAFIQLVAKRSLAEARAEAQLYDEALGRIAGFETAGGWFVVALGPLGSADAGGRLSRLRAEDRVPRDAFVSDGATYRARFWPPAGASTVPVQVPAAPSGETLREARAAEAALAQPERKLVQEALSGAGFYDGPIDAAFGRGTRTAMAAWQGARGHEPTGVLTTAQRAALIEEHEAVFEGLGLAVVEDAPAGVTVEMPTALLALETRETPFSRYVATDGGEAKLLLVSQEGDRRTLAGLFEVMRSLEIIPREGEHELDGDRFVIQGRDDRVVARGFAELEDGRIKGMLLVWPADDEARRARLWKRMRRSFDGSAETTLGEAEATPPEAQSALRLAGLEIRRPEVERSGFYVDEGGAVLTTAEVAQGCDAILIDDAHEARVAWSDGSLALLRPERPLAPARVATIAEGPARLGSRLAVAGYPFGGALEAASLTFGRLEDLRGLAGEEAVDRYALTPEAGDAGGPVLAEDGSVTGLLLPAEAGDRALPEGVAFGVDAARLAQALREAGIEPREPPAGGTPTTPERLAREAAEMTVLVACHQ